MFGLSLVTSSLCCFRFQNAEYIEFDDDHQVLAGSLGDRRENISRQHVLHSFHNPGFIISEPGKSAVYHESMHSELLGYCHNFRVFPPSGVGSYVVGSLAHMDMVQQWETHTPPLSIRHRVR